MQVFENSEINYRIGGALRTKAKATQA